MKTEIDGKSLHVIHVGDNHCSHEEIVCEFADHLRNRNSHECAHPKFNDGPGTLFCSKPSRIFLGDEDYLKYLAIKLTT